MDEDNLTRQCDEIEALSAIYGDNWTVESVVNRIYSILLNSEVEDSSSIEMKITLPINYPKEDPPAFEIHAPWLKGNQKVELTYELNKLYLENIGESIIFLWAEKVRDYLQNHIEIVTEVGEEIPSISKQKIIGEDSSIELPCPNIYHGEPIVDRKSTFQAHLANVKSLDDFQAMKNLLLQNPKIAKATHNIVAYRMKKKDNTIQDCDDDGEHSAGGRLLHLLQILDVMNVAVIVSRWYGGIQLGPDRFRHINNAARNILQQEGFLSIVNKSHKKHKKNE